MSRYMTTAELAELCRTSASQGARVEHGTSQRTIQQEPVHAACTDPTVTQPRPSAKQWRLPTPNQNPAAKPRN